MIEIKEILQILPHRYPFVLVDQVTKIDPPGPGSWVGRKLEAIKNVTINEPFFNGHFPGSPVMPGVLILEALAQTGGLLTHLSVMDGNCSGKEGKLFYLVKIDNARFSKMVVPGTSR